jgi:hypothetical protein
LYDVCGTLIAVEESGKAQGEFMLVFLATPHTTQTMPTCHMQVAKTARPVMGPYLYVSSFMHLLDGQKKRKTTQLRNFVTRQRSRHQHRSPLFTKTEVGRWTLVIYV